MFFQFERENNVNQNNVADLKLTLVEVGTGMAKFALEPGFGRYFDPIFAWGRQENGTHYRMLYSPI